MIHPIDIKVENFPFNQCDWDGGRWYAWCDALHASKNEAEREGWKPISEETKLKAYEIAKRDKRWKL